MSSTKYGDFVWERGFFKSAGKYYPPVPDSKRLKKANFKYSKKLKNGDDFSSLFSIVHNSTYFPGLVTEDNAYAGFTEKNNYLASFDFHKNYGLNQIKELNIVFNASNQTSTPLFDSNEVNVTSNNNKDDISYYNISADFHRSVLLSPIKWLSSSPLLTYGLDSSFVKVDGFVYGDNSHNLYTNSAFSQLELTKNRFNLNISGIQNLNYLSSGNLKLLFRKS
jgi:hypothetical protein